MDDVIYEQPLTIAFIRPILQTSLACRPSERGGLEGKRISYLQVTELEGR